MRKLLAVLPILALVFAFAEPAAAQNPHLNRAPRITDQGTQLQVSGRIVGLGSEPLNVIVQADGVAIVDCRNPGGNVAPGQRTNVDIVGQTGTVSPDRQGRYDFNITTAEPTVGSEACPNRQWTPIVRDVEFSNVRIFVEQPIGSTPRQIYP